MALKIEKVVAALPPVLEPNAIYLVRTGAGFEIRVVDSTGTTAHTLNGGGGSPGGSSGQLQFNDGGIFGGAAQVEVDAEGNLVLIGNTSKPAPHVEGLQVYSRLRAGGLWLDAQRPSGRDFPLQPHFGVNRIATWSPSTGTAVIASGMPRTGVGTASHPAPSSNAPQPKASSRRWRMTSAATAGSPADERSAALVCWRGNAEGLGGWTYTNRLSLQALQATSAAFFGLTASSGALAGTLDISTMTNVFGIGFVNGTHANWQVVRNDAAGAAVFTDMGANFPINTNDLLTLFIYAMPNGSEIGVRLVNEGSGAVYDAAFSTNIPSNATFLTVRNYLNNGGVAAAVAYDCCGVYMETDY